MIETIGYFCIFVGGAAFGYWLCKRKKINI